jgi:serine/threonine protein kinase
MSDSPVDGRYRLLEVIGSGGMGRVWRAQDELLLRTVAIKEITETSDEQLTEQVVREARAAARLDHPGVVKVFDVVRQDGRSWIVMEYVDSSSLHQKVSADGPLPAREVARIGLRCWPPCGPRTPPGCCTAT